ncbi:MAG: hypothetical protein AABZ74_10210, partial [Cyanobacteriota bacterium]
MKKIALVSLCLSFFSLSSFAQNDKYKAVDEFEKEKFSLNTTDYLKKSTISGKEVEFDQKKMLSTIISTLDYISKNIDSDQVIKRDGFLGSLDIKLQNVVDTLNFIKKIIEEDLETGKNRLKDTDFINKNFKVIKWNPYNPKDLKQKNIRITKYAIFNHNGSKTKTKEFNVPLYELKEKGDFYKKYTKQDVLSGIYEKENTKKVSPLVYLTRDGLEEALMEGTLLVKFPDGSKKYYNVDKNNGISYVKGLKREAQKRYWYFKNVEGINGYGKDIENKVKIEDSVTFAGDVFNIGLGKIVVLDYQINTKKHLRLGIIADTGGAFLPNLHQLDLLAGTFKNKEEFNTYSQYLPSYADVSFLFLK